MHTFICFFLISLFLLSCARTQIMQQLRSYNYVTDCVSALICVLLHGNSREAYNLANPQSKLTIAEFAKKIGEFGNCNVIFEKTNTTDVVNQSPIPKQVLNSEKIEKLGWWTAFDLEEVISHTLDTLKKYIRRVNIRHS